MRNRRPHHHLRKRHHVSRPPERITRHEVDHVAATRSPNTDGDRRSSPPPPTRTATFLEYVPDELVLVLAVFLLVVMLVVWLVERLVPGQTASETPPERQ